MKKLFVAAALVMGLGTSATFADNFMVDSVTVTMINDFTPIEVKDLPAAVQEAITKNYAESTIKEAAVEANEDGTKTYKVVLRLHSPVFHGRNTQRPLFAVLFADIDPFQRLGIVSPAFQFADCLKLRFWGFP